MAEVTALFGEPEKSPTFACRRRLGHCRLQTSTFVRCLPLRQFATSLKHPEGASALRSRIIGKGKTERPDSIDDSHVHVVDPAYNRICSFAW